MNTGERCHSVLATSSVPSRVRSLASAMLLSDGILRSAA
jgi:hypothetical protein